MRQLTGRLTASRYTVEEPLALDGVIYTQAFSHLSSVDVIALTIRVRLTCVLHDIRYTIKATSVTNAAQNERATEGEKYRLIPPPRWVLQNAVAQTAMIDEHQKKLPSSFAFVPYQVFSEQACPIALSAAPMLESRDRQSAHVGQYTTLCA